MPWLRVVDSFFFQIYCGLECLWPMPDLFCSISYLPFSFFFFYSADQEQAREAAAKAEAEAQQLRLAYHAVFCVCVCVCVASEFPCRGCGWWIVFFIIIFLRP